MHSAMEGTAGTAAGAGADAGVGAGVKSQNGCLLVVLECLQRKASGCENVEVALNVLNALNCIIALNILHFNHI